jgi:DMSO/TMAO reductase YedYZ molybdopterin-dependent catalytic subunit
MSPLVHNDNPDLSSEFQRECSETERNAFVRLDPSGFQIRHPPPPHELTTYITPDDKLFHTMHMGASVIDLSRYRLVVSGLVDCPITLTLDDLKSMPQTTITSFHECYGSPLKPPTERSNRVGNVIWTGVRVSHILSLAGIPSNKPTISSTSISPTTPTISNLFLHAHGLDRGTFASTNSPSYTKDLPLSKALAPECLIAHSMNGSPLTKERGYPARLIVPGYFGTNSVKWVCRLEVRAERATGVYTTKWYNEIHENGEVSPVWGVGVNSLITRPTEGEVLAEGEVAVEGWAWSEMGVGKVDVSGDGGKTWREERVDGREGFGWQRFGGRVQVGKGRCEIVARAEGEKGDMQPLEERRNCVHRVGVLVEEHQSVASQRLEDKL